MLIILIIHVHLLLKTIQPSHSQLLNAEDTPTPKCSLCHIWTQGHTHSVTYFHIWINGRPIHTCVFYIYIFFLYSRTHPLRVALIPIFGLKDTPIQRCLSFNTSFKTAHIPIFNSTDTPTQCCSHLHIQTDGHTP